MLPEEKRKLESYPQLNEYYCSDDEGKYWAPIHWAITYTIRARQEGKIATDMWCTRITDVRYYGQWHKSDAVNQ